jgi:hypothetical protein
VFELWHDPDGHVSYAGAIGPEVKTMMGGNMRHIVRTSARRPARLLGALTAILALALGASGPALASENFGGMVPAKSVSFSPSEPSNLIEIIAERYSGEGGICIGPATFPGPKYPYGFQCGNPQVYWNFASIKAHAAIDNPNSKAVGIGALAVF